jgi:alpha-2-macroglobulin
MKRLAFLALFVATAAFAQEKKLTVVKAGPVGELTQLAEANEIRIVFSEPMVVVGKIPKNLTVPWFHISPEVKGTFRWAGTTTLIFTPEKPLPYATKYDVRIAEPRLDRPYTFSFTTPVIQLTQTYWYRKGDKADAPLVIGLYFNQPVEKDTLAPHLQLRTAKHDFQPPAMPGNDAAYEAKVAKAKAAAESHGAPVMSFFTDDWDRKKMPPLPESQFLVVQTKPGVPPETFLQVYIDDQLAKSPANVRTGRAQTYTIELEPTFFVERIECVKACNPEMYDPIIFRAKNGVNFNLLKKAITVVDVTDPAKEVPVQPTGKREMSEWQMHSRSYSLDELGYSVQPAHTYRVRIDPSLEAEDGQRLGYAWTATIEFWHKGAFTSFGGGHGVWESSGGPLLPFHARNYRSVQQWLKPLALDEVMPTILSLQKVGFNKTPPVPPVDRKLAPVPDKIQSYGLNLKSVLSPQNTGIVWAAVKPGQPIPRTPEYPAEVTATVVQATNLGISVKDSPQNTLVFVTRLDDAKPVAGAKVSIRTTDNKVFWTGTTDEKGIAVAPNTDLRVDRKKKSDAGGECEDCDSTWQALEGIHFIVTAEKDGDAAYVVSDWHEGISPWDFDSIGFFNLDEALPTLRGTIFTDRGVYKPGEEIHAKIVLRSDTPSGMQLLRAGTAVDIVTTDSHSKEVDKRTVTLNDWSSAEWVWRVPAEGNLGNYVITARVKDVRLQANGEFLVAAYRRPEFRVDVTLTAPSSVAGTKLAGTITGRYLFGAPMSSRPVKWTYSKSPLYDIPRKVSERFPEDQWHFLGDYENTRVKTVVETKEEKLNAKGELKLSLDTDLEAGHPWAYTLEGAVTDVSRQVIANRTSFRVDPAPWYIGLRRLPYFGEAAKGIDTQVVAVALDGTPAAGVDVEVNLVRIQWNSVRKAEGRGFYAWETERKEIPAGKWTVTTQAQPAPLHIPLENGGFYNVIATAKDAEGRSTTTRTSFYAIGAGYTAWERYDHNRIDLEPEKKNLRPGESARIMIKSPWERATALLTTEREGVRTWRQFELTSTQTTVSVPITEKDIPNVFVSVLLLKGRTKEGTEDESDPGKPAFRLGYTELTVEDATKRLKVDVKANKDEYRPATKARIEVNVKDAAGKPSQSEVTLWAVDYGVLSLTAYQTPDVLESIYLRKSLQVINEESRAKIISHRVLTPKGADDGGGGGKDAGPSVVRKDFRVLAFWVGSVITDAKGRARTEITLPESLTTYRIMAVAGDKQSRFGWGQNEIRINKPVLLTPTWPRFLALGDKALMGGVVHSQLTKAGKATVTIKSLDPSIVEFTGETKTQVDVAPGGAPEVRFNAVAKAVGTARIQMTVSLNGESDAFEDALPVRVLQPAETVAAYGESKGTSKQTLEIPKNVAPTAGGLHIELASTAMVGLAGGAQYLIEYPYGCAEQRSSAAMALMVASDLGEAFALPGIDAKSGKAAAQRTIYELYRFQCGNGGFSFWPGDCWGVSPYLTANVLHVMQRGKKLGYDVSDDVMKRAYDYLDAQLKEKRPTNEAYWPFYTAWQAFAVKVLTEGGRNEDSHINRLYSYADRMPVFGIAYLLDAMTAKGEKGQRADDLKRRINNAIQPEAGSAHVAELSDPYLLYCWSSTVRTTAITLGTLVRDTDDEQVAKQIVRWLMQVRKDGRWGNTQENVWAMESLVDYYRKYEKETPDFTAVVTLGSETLARDEFRGRSTDAKSHDIPMPSLMTKPSGDVTFERQGTGTLFYLMRLRYVPLGTLDALNQGFSVTRTYSQKTFKAGDLIKVTLKIRNTKERRFVAVTDPIPAGTEPVESWFATTASDLAEAQAKADSGSDWTSWWRRGGFDHIERHDDRVNLFATRLGEGTHEFTYMIRATTAGTFVTAPAHAEEMYAPEVFGRTATTVIEVQP